MLSQSPLHIAGTSAAPGYARGPLYLLADDDVQLRSRKPGAAQHEAALLRAALHAATGELSALMAQSADPDAHGLLEFQIAMLEDEPVVQPAFVAIEAGATADAAWLAALDAQIQDYREAEDAYFAARASDLQDMRDRVLRCLSGSIHAAIPPGAIVVATDLAPSRFLEIDWHGGGIALFAGSPHSHVATLARARGVPMIVRLHTEPALPAGDVLLDADEGVLMAAGDSAAVDAFNARRAASERARRSDAHFITRPATTADGERVEVMLNVAHLDELGANSAQSCDGIGLVRTELLLHGSAELNDEQCQFERYRAIVDWAGGRPVTFRTLDAGGDKPIAGYTVAGEPNPFLGMRGVRLSLIHPELLSVQLRALARSAAVGNVKIMVPMVTVPSELDRVRSMLMAAVTDLRERGVPCGLPPLGMMVEVPAAALTIDVFNADFFSIGSNDLIAYLTASSRDSAALAALTDPLAPAVLRLVRLIVDAARVAGRALSVCGDMAGEPRYLRALLSSGVRSISIAPTALGPVKKAIAAYSVSEDD